MTIFDSSEKEEYLATQCLGYDKYSCHRYFLERVDVLGKYGLVCGEEAEDCGSHAKVLLQPVYKEIRVCKISSPKAIYDKYAVFVNGNQMGIFTLGLNSWVLCKNYQNN
ncbi:MAG TPA: hypothetical protein VLE49_10275 [Anaerolineales bacterium]|nr:hypothetical protein [Anaerolineales bacterium]